MKQEIYFNESSGNNQISGKYLLVGKPEKDWDAAIRTKIQDAQISYDKKFSLNEVISKMKKAETKFRDLYEQAPFMYCSIDRNGIITECNYAGCKMLGYSMNEMKGLQIRDILLNFDEDKFWEICETHSGLKGLEGIFLTKDKTELFISMDATVSIRLFRQYSRYTLHCC